MARARTPHPPHAHDTELGLRLAPEGYGPLLERDYWGVIAGCRVSPAEIGELLAQRFAELAPAELVRFRRLGGDVEERPLQVGDRLEVEIRYAGTFAVEVLHREAGSLTLGTVAGHPEAGRITFGAYRNARGDVLFHIRSRARSGSRSQRYGFLTAGEPMQTNTWTDFVNRVALAVGDGLVGAIRAATREVEEEPDEGAPKPTFRVRDEAEAPGRNERDEVDHG